MTTPFRANRKATNEQILALNAMGYKLQRIARELGLHPSTVTLRLKRLGVQPADTRRDFMTGIYDTLSEKHMERLQTKLSANFPIKDYVKKLILDDLLNDNDPSETQTKD